MARLVYTSVDKQERVFELGEHTTVGRHPSCQLQVLDRQVSKAHFEIWERDRSYWIRDLATLNGTWVNRVRLITERRLEHLDEIQAAYVRFLFLDADAPLRRSPTGNPYRKAAPPPSSEPARKVDEPRVESERGDLTSLRRFYALVRMLSNETDERQLAVDAAHGLFSLCEADWVVLCTRRPDGEFEELARAGRDKPPEVTTPFPGLFDIAARAKAPTFQLGQDRVLQLVVPLVRGGEANGVFWVGLTPALAIPPTVEMLGTYASFVSLALDALRR
jgi:hypothetical protein